jgi:SAM-dependent methyltransferase
MALRKAARAIMDVQQLVFERWLGVSTGGHVYLDDLGLGDADRAFYEGCQWLPTRRALRSLRPGPRDVFADLGSGKGQALLIAGRLPYARVIGVELADNLSRAAERNIAEARPRLKAATVEAVTADVLTWEIPDDLSVVYMFCPFTDELFERTAERIYASYDAHPRSLHIVYSYPWEHNRLISRGRVLVEDVLPAQWPAKPWWWRTGWVTVIYRVVAAGQGAAGVPPVRRRFLRPQRALERWSATNDQTFELVRDGRVVKRSSP